MMLERWKNMDKVMIIILLLMTFFAYADSNNLIGIKTIDSSWQNQELWVIFNNQIIPSFFLAWIAAFGAIAIIYYVYNKDVSESIALFITPTILVIFGVQDIMYYIFSPDTLAGTIGCWANVLPGVNIFTRIIGAECPTITTFILSALTGIVIASLLYKYLREKL